MIVDGKSVGLVAGLLYQLERLRLLINIDRYGIFGEVDFFQLLGDSDHSDLVTETQLVDALHGRAQLAFTPINDDKLRKRLFFLK